MQVFLYHLTTVSVVVVLLVLAVGLWTMLRGTDAGLSQKLMRWRVGLQFFAIIAIIGYAVIAR